MSDEPIKLTDDEREALDYAVFGAAGDGHDTFATVEDTVERIIAERMAQVPRGDA